MEKHFAKSILQNKKGTSLMAILIQSSGTQTDDIEPKNGQRFTQGEMQDILNCQRFPALRIGENNLLFIDTNGMRRGKRANRQASIMAEAVLYHDSDYVAGNAFFVPFCFRF